MADVHSAVHATTVANEWSGTSGTPVLVTTPFYRIPNAVTLTWAGATQAVRVTGLNLASVYQRIAFRVTIGTNPSAPYSCSFFSTSNAVDATGLVKINVSAAGVITLSLLNAGDGSFDPVGSNLSISEDVWYLGELKTIVSATVGALELKITNTVTGVTTTAGATGLNTGTTNVTTLEYTIQALANGLAGSVTWSAELTSDSAYPGGLAVGDIWAPGLVGHSATPAFTASSGASLAPTLPPNWAENDIHVLVCHHSGNGPFTTPSGWTIVTGLDDNNTVDQRVTIFGRRAVAGDTAPSVVLTTNTVTTVRGATIYGVRGCPTNGTVLDVIDVVARNLNAAAATISFPTVTTLQAHDLVLAIGAYEDDPTTRSLPAGWKAPTGAVQGSTLGNDMAFSYFWRVFATGATGTFSTTVSGGTFTNSVSVGAIIALKGIAVPAVATLMALERTKFRRINGRVFGRVN